MLTVTVQVAAPADMAQAVKEALAMWLERYGDAQVVRCRECQHVVAEAMFPGGLICRLTRSVVIPDGFCYRGKLQTNAEQEG